MTIDVNMAFLAGIWTIENLPLAVIILLVSVCLFLWYNKRTQRSYPPCYNGIIPWLGCAIEFGKEPLYFIQRAKAKMGDTFTLKVAGKRLTFLTAPEDSQVFFNSPNLDFQGAVQQPVKNTANIPSEAFYKSHTKIHDTVKGRLGPSQLQPFAEQLLVKFTKNMCEWGESGNGDLYRMVRSTMYKAVLDNLFGENILLTHNQEMFQELESHFTRFDDDFEYGSQLPEFFLKEWSMSKKWLLKLFYTLVPNLKQVPQNEETVLQTLIRTVGGKYSANFGLLMMWASLANAIPITFWTLAFILNTPDVLKQIHNELNAVMDKKGASFINEDDLNKLPTIRNSIVEAIRLRSPGVITRRVTKDIKLKDFIIPAGDHLMLSPYWAHRNEKFFPKPEKFDPARWLKVEDKSQFLEGFVAFGGGRYQCPGRWFALMEIQIYVALVLHHFDLELKGTVPPHSPLHLVGTQQPVGPCPVIFTKRKTLNLETN